MKKVIMVVVMVLMVSVSMVSAATWKNPVDVPNVSVKFGELINSTTVSNSTKYSVSRNTPVYAPSDGKLIRWYGNFVTYKNSDGVIWEVNGIINMNPAQNVKAGDYLGYTNNMYFYVIISDEVTPFVNYRYMPPFTKTINTCSSINYFNLEAFIPK